MTLSFKSMIDAGVTTLQSLEALEPLVIQAGELITKAIKDGHKVLTCGNGGSAADASHLATEFVVRYIQDRRPYPAIALTESGSTITAASNDYDYDQVFARQVWALGQQGDVLIVFSTSGRSPSILHALDQAHELGVNSIALLGRDGGPAKGKATIDLIVPNDSTARVQEAHTLLIHALCEMVERELA